MEIIGCVVDVQNKTMYTGKVVVVDGIIAEIVNIGDAGLTPNGPFILPGFIDAHVHIESSMLPPSEFGRIAVQHGTVATVSDPHEIANVLGVAGVEMMLEDANKTPLKIHFGAPSCVPATSFETAGAVLDVDDVTSLLKRADIFYLSEMMNYPGVLFKDEAVMQKIAAAHALGKPVDGHAPGLMGEDAISYINAGISTDHECFTLEEALHKLKNGMKIIIREGSAARNFNELHPIIAENAAQCMFCSDDKHPDDLLLGHINLLVKRALQLGYDLFDVLQMACINPVIHYNLPVGLLRKGDAGDFIVLDSLTDFTILKTVINGEIVFEKGKPSLEVQLPKTPNVFNLNSVKPHDFQIKASGNQVNVIVALNKQIVTGSTIENIKIDEQGNGLANQEKDILKIAVVNRYSSQPIHAGFISGFGLKDAAIASSVAHDSHNVVVVGTNDDLMAKAVNQLVESKGGISFASTIKEGCLPLAIAGLMSALPAEKVAEKYQALDLMAKNAGSNLDTPYMTLSFMALLVIPSLKMSDLGLFNGTKFNFQPLFI